jgi:hypothetical protein
MIAYLVLSFLFTAAVQVAVIILRFQFDALKGEVKALRERIDKKGL